MAGGLIKGEELGGEVAESVREAACLATMSLRVSVPHQPASVYRRKVSSSAQRLRLLVGLPDGQCLVAGSATGFRAGSGLERGDAWEATGCCSILEFSDLRLTAHSLIEVKSK